MWFALAAPTATHGHTGYLAGRYRDGAYSDGWTDVRRCAPGTFTAHAPACSCGWRGAPQPISSTTPITCGRRWVIEHLHTVDHTTPADAHAEHSTPSR